MNTKSNEVTVERRHLVESELRLLDGGSEGNSLRKIVGYAAVFNSRSEDLGGFREIIRPGAFNRNFPDADVRALIDHDPSRIIGRTKSGTLTLSVNNKGLIAEVMPPDTTVGRDISESIKRGDVDGMSFGFRTISDQWSMQDGEVIRELLDVTLDHGDVSFVTYPAYRQTSVAVRSFDDEIMGKSELVRSIRKLERDFELSDDESKLVIEHRSLLRAKLPEDLAEKLFKEDRAACLSVLKLRQQLIELEI